MSEAVPGRVTDEMVLAFIKASDSQGFGAAKSSFLWEMTERGLKAALTTLRADAAKAREEEREACAKIADQFDQYTGAGREDVNGDLIAMFGRGNRNARSHIAAAIRQRGTPTKEKVTP